MTNTLYQRELTINATSETIYSFFIEPDKLLRWKGIHAELDVRIGGTYRLTIGEDRIAIGSYLEINQPTLLRFTWGWENLSDLPPGSSVVTIVLKPQQTTTLLQLTHDGLNQEQFLFQQQGWEYYLPRLQQVIENNQILQ